MIQSVDHNKSGVMLRAGQMDTLPPAFEWTGRGRRWETRSTYKGCVLFGSSESVLPLNMRYSSAITSNVRVIAKRRRVYSSEGRVAEEEGGGRFPIELKEMIEIELRSSRAYSNQRMGLKSSQVEQSRLVGVI